MDEFICLGCRHVGEMISIINQPVQVPPMNQLQVPGGPPKVAMQSVKIKFSMCKKWLTQIQGRVVSCCHFEEKEKKQVGEGEEASSE